MAELGLAGHATFYELMNEPTSWVRRRALDTGGAKAIETPRTVIQDKHRGLEVAPGSSWIATFGREGAAFFAGMGGLRREVASVGRMHDVVALDDGHVILITDHSWQRVDVTLVSLDDGN